MRITTNLYMAAVFVGCAIASPAFAAVVFEDNFTGTGTLDGHVPDNDGNGSLWTGGADLVTLNGGRAFFNGTGIEGGVSPKFDGDIFFPTVSSGERLVTSVEISSVDANPVGVGAFYLTAVGIGGGPGQGNELYMAGLGNDVGAGGSQATGTYSVGTWFEPPTPAPANQRIVTTDPLPAAGSSDSHVVTTWFTATAGGMERQSFLAINGGTPSLLGPLLLFPFEEYNGTGPENPGFVNSIRTSARGTTADLITPSHGAIRNFSSSFIKIETVTIPEPASVALLALAGLLIAFWRRRRR